MPSVEELSVAAVRSAMAPGFELDQVASDLLGRAQDNGTALKLARARVERGAGWRAGPIGQRARDALTRAIELSEHPQAERIPEIDLTDGSSRLGGPLHA
jgi:hypothetical protein